jgi:hypothetical protein
MSLVVHGQAPLESILSLEGINWHESKWSENKGAVPVIPKDSEAYHDVVDEIAELESYPIKRDELAGILYRLQGHYWVSGMPESVARAVAEDYLRLLLPKGYTLKAVQGASDSWLTNPTNRFFPKIGEFEEALKMETSKIKWRLLRLKKLKEKAR